MKFLIRDDDPCGFTDPEELLRCYKYIWGTVPVNFSVTPFRIPSKDKNVPKHLFGSEVMIPLESNTELVSMFKQLHENGNVDFAMHGYNHIKPDGLAEYVGGSDLLSKTTKGKLYLENLLDCEIKTFVPPHNSIAREGFEAVVKNNMNLVGVPSFLWPKYRPLKFNSIPKYLKQKYYKSLYKINYPHVFSFNDHQEVNYVPVTPSQSMKNIKHVFHKSYDLDAVFIFSVHYHAFDKRLCSGELIRDALSEIIDIAEGLPNVDYIRYKDLWNQ